MEKEIWKELIDQTDREEMQRIVRLLVEFDERTGRYLKYSDPETHWARKACAIAKEIRIFVCPVAELVYSVVCLISTESTNLSTAWIHEDGIAQERKEAEDGHPVHKIVCLTDLYQRGDEGSAALFLSTESSAQKLMWTRALA